jgi:DNA polymerase-3 subunit gamma/tau
MAKDEQTLPLLEVSQRQADKYKEQAKKCPARFLYQALKLMSQCDLGYRQSSNKRLLVELTLIEIAQITQEEDTPAAGRSPRRLKSLFQKLVRSVQQQKTAQQVAAAEPKPLHTARVSAQQNGSKNQDADARPVAPKLKLGNLGMSFASLRKGDGKKPIPETTPPETAKNEQQQFTEEEMIAQWVAMCQRMPQQMAGIAARMRNMRPHITEYPHILAVVDNQILLDQMNAIRGRIRSTLAMALHNDDITLDLQMAQDNEVTKVLSRKELFEEISTKNPAISKLRGLLDLELA